MEVESIFFKLLAYKLSLSKEVTNSKDSNPTYSKNKTISNSWDSDEDLKSETNLIESGDKKDMQRRGHSKKRSRH